MRNKPIGLLFISVFAVFLAGRQIKCLFANFQALPLPVKKKTSHSKGFSALIELKSHRQNSGWMSSNPILSQFSGWNELHGGFMQRTTARKLAKMGKLIAAHEFCLWLYI